MKLPQYLTTVTPFSKLITMFLFILFPFIGFYLGMRYRSIVDKSNQQVIVPTIIPTSEVTPSSPSMDSTVNWKTYDNKDFNFQFKYPTDWNTNPIQFVGSSYSLKLQDPAGVYSFYFRSEGNYNQETGKAHKDIYEFLKFQYKLKTVTVGGIEAVQALPRAGSESDFAVFFFAKDSISIYTIELDTPRDGSKFQEGEKLFYQILSTFKFTDQKQINNNTQSLDEKIASCQGIKNGSALTVKETTRMFINLPKDVYPDKEHNLHITTLNGNATAGYISNAGPPGQAFQATQDCWSYYDEFDGNGTVQINVPSAVKGIPNYNITVKVTISN